MIETPGSGSHVFASVTVHREQDDREAHERYGEAFVRVSAALYRDGRDSVAFHGDTTARDLVQATVATISLGAARRFMLKPKEGGRSQPYALGGGDLVVMGGTCRWGRSANRGDVSASLDRPLDLQIQRTARALGLAMIRDTTVKRLERWVIAVLVLGLCQLALAEPAAGLMGGIEGTIASQTGTPISGASVAIRGAASTCGSRIVTTDGGGHFSATGLPACVYAVTASATGFMVAGRQVTVTAGGTASLALTLVQVGVGRAKAEPVTKRPPSDKPAPRPIRRYDMSPPPSPIAPSVKPPPPQPIQLADRERDAEHDTEQYALIDENPFLAVHAHPLSTFSADVDTASYALVRQALRLGALPKPDAVRLEELINYFHYDLPPPPQGQPFSITTEVGASPFNTHYQIVRIGLQTSAIEDAKVPPRNLTFLIDVSGSMFASNKLPLLKRALLLLVDQLRPEDKVAMVVYAGTSGLVLPPTRGTDKATIRDALAALEAGGSTNGGAGIKLAYDTAQRSFVKGGINRVILCTDGDFNVGTTSEGDLARLIEGEREKGVFLTVLGFGMGNLKDSTMEKLADRGNGNYAYIDTIEEARKVLVKQAGATLVTVAKDVKLQVEFNPTQVAGYRLIGYEKRLLRDEDFNDDKKDAGDLGAGHSVSALYEVIPAGQAVPGAKVDGLKYQTAPATNGTASAAEMMTVKLRYKEPDGKTSRLLSQPVQAAQTELARTSTDFRWAVAVAGYGMMLRESKHRGNLNWKQVEALAEGAVGADLEGYRKELVELVKIAAKLSRS